MSSVGIHTFYDRKVIFFFGVQKADGLHSGGMGLGQVYTYKWNAN